MSRPAEIRPVATGADLHSFVTLPFSLYRGDPMWIPQLISHEKAQFDPSRNPAFESAEARLFLAESGGRVTGRIAAIVSRASNERWNRRCGRFGWFECVEDSETAARLFGAAEEWLASKGMDEVSGPLGFTDNDPRGFLVEGFSELPTIANSYNPRWYPEFAESRGYSKEVDFVEYRITVPKELPERIVRLGEQIAARSGVRVFAEKSTRALARRWGRQVFEVLNAAYSELYGTTALSEAQMDFYIRNYLGQVDPEFVKLATDGDRLVGFIIAMPNLSRAFQRAGGRLLPLGFIHLLRGMRTSRVLDFYLAGILPEYRNRGIDVLMALEMGRSAIARGMEHAESNYELESNNLVQSMWKLYERRLHRRSRVYNRRLDA